MILFLVGAVVAVAAAARSTWSPCGLSMLSTITPVGERARRHRYAVTAGWFMLGSAIGGSTLGAVAAGLAAALSAAGAAGAAGARSALVLGTGAALALAAALVDAGAFGPVLPLIRRQVDDRWLARYRPWVYGVGFGWQIGVGFATYLMTAGVVLVAALGVLTGSPAAAFGLAVLFGVARGSTVFLTAGATTAAGLRALHGRLDRVGPGVRRAVVGVQAGAAAGLALAAVLAGSGTSSSAAATGTAVAMSVLGGAAGAAVAPFRRLAAPSAGVS